MLLLSSLSAAPRVEAPGLRLCSLLVPCSCEQLSQCLVAGGLLHSGPCLQLRGFGVNREAFSLHPHFGWGQSDKSTRSLKLWEKPEAPARGCEDSGVGTQAGATRLALCCVATAGACRVSDTVMWVGAQGVGFKADRHVWCSQALELWAVHSWASSCVFE